MDKEQKSDKEIEEFLKRFFSIAKTGKNLTLEDIRKLEEESYDFP